MKQLTPEEFSALGDGPHDARVVGVPPEDVSILVWREDDGEPYWEAAWSTGRSWWSQYGLPEIAKNPFWHKLPADIERKA